MGWLFISKHEAILKNFFIAQLRLDCSSVRIRVDAYKCLIQFKFCKVTGNLAWPFGIPPRLHPDSHLSNKIGLNLGETALSSQPRVRNPDEAIQTKQRTLLCP